MKQVIVIRKDLQLGKGKLAAHAAHASLSAYRNALESHKGDVNDWVAAGEKKVVVAIDSESAILELFERVKRAKLPCALIRDAGLTQISPGTITALGIGPAEDDKIDVLTKDLKLL